MLFTSNDLGLSPGTVKSSVNPPFTLRLGEKRCSIGANTNSDGQYLSHRCWFQSASCRMTDGSKTGYCVEAVGEFANRAGQRQLDALQRTRKGRGTTATRKVAGYSFI